jgi:hypothetical protein
MPGLIRSLASVRTPKQLDNIDGRGLATVPGEAR